MGKIEECGYIQILLALKYQSVEAKVVQQQTSKPVSVLNVSIIRKQIKLGQRQTGTYSFVFCYDAF